MFLLQSRAVNRKYFCLLNLGCDHDSEFTEGGGHKHYKPWRDWIWIGFATSYLTHLSQSECT